MAPKKVSQKGHLDTKDETKWTAELVRDYLASSHEGSGPFFRNAFRWDDNRLAEAKQAALTKCEAQDIDMSKRFPGQTQYGIEKLSLIETALHNDTRYEGLFAAPHLARQSKDKPHWWFEGLLQVERDPTVEYQFKTLVRRFVVWAFGQRKKDITKTEEQDNKEQEVRQRSTKRSRTPSAGSRNTRGRHESIPTIASPMRRLNFLSDTTSDVGGSDTMFPITGPVKTPFDHICVSLVLVIVQGNRLTLSSNKVPLEFMLADRHRVDPKHWTRAIEESLQGARVDDLEAFWFNRSSLWVIRNNNDLNGAIRTLYNNMDTHINNSSVDIFLAHGREHMELIPEEYKVPSNRTEQEIVVWLQARDPVLFDEGILTARDIETAEQIQAEIYQDHFSDEDDNAMQGQEHNQEINVRTGEDQSIEGEQQHNDNAMQGQEHNQEIHVRTGEDQSIEGEQQHNDKGIPPVVTSDPVQSAPFFPWMVRMDEASIATKPFARETPSIDLRGYCESVELVPWLSSLTSIAEGAIETAGSPPTLTDTNEEADSTEQLQDTNEFFRSQIQLDHFSRESWEQTCDFFGFDVTDVDPRSGIYYEGWSKDKHIRAYQMFVIAHVLKQISLGKDLQIVALAMGLGKTLIGIAILDILRRKQGTLNQRVDTNDTDSDYFNLERLAGATPKLPSGATLIIVPTTLLGQWIEEIKKFVVRDRPKIIVAYSVATFTKAQKDGVYKGCYHWKDKVPEAELPPRSELENYWYRKDLDDWFQSGGIPILDLLDPTASGEAPSWLHNWFVLTTPQAARGMIWSKDPSTGTVIEGNIKSRWAVVLFDEYHSVRSVSASPFQTLAGLLGRPPLILMSATPFSKTRDIMPAVVTAFAKYYRFSVNGVKSMFTSTNQSDLANLDHYQLKVNVNNNTKKVLNRSIWPAIKNICAHIDNTINSNTLKEGSTSCVVPNELDKQVRSSLSQFRGYLRDKMIQFDSDFVWQPDPSRGKMPAIDIPPHSAFDLHVDIDTQYQPDLKVIWEQEFARTFTLSKQEQANQFMSVVEKWKVRMLFPCVEELMRLYPDVRDELEGFSRTEAMALEKSGRKSRLYEHMAVFHELNSMKLIRRMITEFRNQMNKLDHPRKIVFASFKPLNAVILQLYLLWLVEQASSVFPSLNGDEEIVFVSSWANKAIMADQLTRFKTTLTRKEGYTDAPFILNAVASQIKVGVSLPPADAIVILDGDWLPASTIQLSGRVNRNRTVQLADNTECFRLICGCDGLPLNQWLAGRHSRYEEIKKELSVRYGASEDTA